MAVTTREFQMADALYGLRSNIKSLAGHRYGETSKLAGVGISKERTASDHGPAKISSAVSMFDAMIAHKGELAAYTNVNDGSVYYEYEGMAMEANGAFYLASDASGDFTAPKYLILGRVLYELAFGTVDELRSAAQRILADPEDPEPDDFYLFSDAFYYGVVKHSDPTINVLDKREAEIEDEFKAGKFVRMDKNFPFLDGFLGTSAKEALMPSAAPAPTAPKKTRKSSKKASSASSKEPTDEELFEMCKEGKLMLKYEWSEEQKKKIQDPKKVLDKYVPCREFFEAVKDAYKHLTRIMKRMADGLTGADAIGDDAVNILISGVPGTGKTTTADAIFAALGLPTEHGPVTEHTEEGHFQGLNVIDDTGKVRYVETPFLEEFENGGAIILDEINLALPSVMMGVLQGAIEKPYQIMKAGYKPVNRHPLCVVVGTCNIGTEGSKPFDAALVTRFSSVEIDELPRATAEAIVAKRTGQDSAVVSWTMEAYTRLHNWLAANAPQLLMYIAATRDCVQAISYMEDGMEPNRAVEKAMVGHIRVADSDPELNSHIHSEVIDVLPKPAFAAPTENLFADLL